MSDTHTYTIHTYNPYTHTCGCIDSNPCISTVYLVKVRGRFRRLPPGCGKGSIVLPFFLSAFEICWAPVPQMENHAQLRYRGRDDSRKLKVRSLYPHIDCKERRRRKTQESKPCTSFRSSSTGQATRRRSMYVLSWSFVKCLPMKVMALSMCRVRSLMARKKAPRKSIACCECRAWHIVQVNRISCKSIAYRASQSHVVHVVHGMSCAFAVRRCTGGMRY